MARTVAVSTARYINYPSGEFSARSITADAVVFDVPTAEGFIVHCKKTPTSKQ